MANVGGCGHANPMVQVVGTIRSEVAQELGLSPDVQVAPGSGDNQMSALGAGAVHEGTWVMSLGTSGTLFGLSTKPVLDPSGAVSPFCDATGSWLPLLCTMNCTTVTEEVHDLSSNCSSMTFSKLYAIGDAAQLNTVDSRHYKAAADYGIALSGSWLPFAEHHDLHQC